MKRRKRKKEEDKITNDKTVGTTFDLIPQRGYVGASRLGHIMHHSKYRMHNVHSVHNRHSVRNAHSAT